MVGSYPFPGWLEFASAHLDQFGEADIEEMRNDAVIAAVHDQVAAGLDVITDGEQTRYDSTFLFMAGWKASIATPHSPRRFGPPAHDQRGKYEVTGKISSAHGLGAVEEFKRLQKIAPPGPGVEGQRARTLHAERPHQSRRSLQRSVGRDRMR